MRIALLLALTLVAACSKDKKPVPMPPPVEVPAKVTGPMSEEDFKALHGLRGDQAPAPTGANIDLAGTRAYLSLPEGKAGPVPGVIVIHEWWGLNDHIKHWTDRIAGLGYAALAVDLYDGVVATNADDAMAAMKAVDTAKAKGVLA